MSTEEMIQKLRNAKTEARARRQQGDRAGEIDRLQSGVERGRVAIARKPASTDLGTASRLVWEVADCLGMLGGALLRQGRMPEAIAVYQEGRDLELSHADAVNLTYNTVNLFVTKLLVGGWRALDDSRADLATVIARLKARTDIEAADVVWTWADLAMCEFLNGQLDAARTSYTKAAALANPDERGSILGRLRMIDEKCQPLTPEQTALLTAVKQILA